MVGEEKFVSCIVSQQWFFYWVSVRLFERQRGLRGGRCGVLRALTRPSSKYVGSGLVRNVVTTVIGL